MTTVPSSAREPQLEALLPTPSQTVGPYFALGLSWSEGPNAVAAGTAGAIRISGRVLDGEGAAVPDALIETWQADPEGRFRRPDDPRGAIAPAGFRGFARCPVDAAGRYSLLTLKPGPLPGPGASTLAPQLLVSVFARGLLRRLVTRIYFGDEEEANAADPVLASLPYPDEVRRTLIAAPAGEEYRFDIRLQGDGETLFFAI